MGPLQPTTEQKGQQKVRYTQLKNFLYVSGDNVTDPTKFKDAPLLTTFIRVNKDSRTEALWAWINAAKDAIPGQQLVDTEHPLLNNLVFKYEGRVPVYIHPSFYRALKLIFPLDVGGMAKNGVPSVDLLNGSLGQACHVLATGDFRPVCDTE